MSSLLWEKARAVAPLADLGTALPAVFALREGRSVLSYIGVPDAPGEIPEINAEERLYLDLRYADLVRRFVPALALEVLAGLPPLSEAEGLSGPAIQVSALIELGRLEEAAVTLMLAPGETGHRALLDGRIALERGQLAEAISAFSQGLELAQDPELRAELLGFRARTLRLANHDAKADQDFAALEDLCTQFNAGLSLSLVRFVRHASAHEAVPALQAAFYRVGLTQLSAQLTLGVEKDREAVAPVPLHVHGAAKKLKSDAPRFVEGLLQIAGLQLSVHSDVDAFETAWYGFAIGQRLFGQPAVVELAAFLTGMRDGIGREAYEKVRAEVEARAEARQRPSKSA